MPKQFLCNEMDSFASIAPKQGAMGLQWDLRKANHAWTLLVLAAVLEMWRLILKHGD